MLETQEETEGLAQSVPTTEPEEDRSTDRRTDRQITHQTDYNITLAALPMVVVSTPSGTSPHAQEIPFPTSLQSGDDLTFDLSVQELFQEPSELANTNLDISLRGRGENRPASPGLTLPATGSLLPGAAPGLESADPSLELQSGVGSCPQAVVLAHPDAYVGATGTDNSAQFWGESQSTQEQERLLQHSTTTATHTTPDNQDTTHIFTSIVSTQCSNFQTTLICDTCFKFLKLLKYFMFML